MRIETGLVMLAAGSIAAAFWGCGDDEQQGSGGSGGSGPASSATTTYPVTQSSTTSGMPGDFIGAECDDDADCAGGLCLRDSDSDPVVLGGPANGYCTIPCIDSADCPGADDLCLTDEGGTVGRCFLGCETGPDLMFIDDPLLRDKCRQREDVACRAFGSGTACYPICGADEQCPPGRVCDPRLAVCVDDPTTGLPDGSPCNPQAMVPECEGVCVNFSSGQTMCSNRCVLGGELDGFDCGGLQQGVCVFRPSGYGPGDQGFCSPSCTQQDHCQNPDWWCFGNNFAQNGYCFTAEDCPGGQIDCTDQADMCTDTIYGPKCLDPAFPLGSAGTGGGGGGGGGGSTTGSTSTGMGGAGGMGVGGAGGAGGS